MQFRFLALVGAALVAAPSVAQAQRVAEGQSNGLSWQATNRIVGVGSTATVVGGGNPAYLPQMPLRSGVVSLIMDYGPGGSFICTGSLLSDRRSILTAAHCVSDGAGTPGPQKVTAWFYGGDEDIVVPNNALAVGIDSIGQSVHKGYTGEVIDQNDIAIVRLGADAPSWARSYEIDFTPGLTGRDFTVAGYGGRSDTGGTIGANLGTGRLREGDNRMDFRWGDSDFGGFFTDVDPVTGENFFGTAEVGFSYVSDFDNGLAANDASCRLAVAGLGLASSAKCDLGRGFREVGVAGGDSGGPQFGADGRLISVTSYGLTFGPNFGDFRQGLNSSFGEFSGYVPLYIHADFIAEAVPEPATWAMMIAGFGLVGAGMRTRNRKLTFA
jgi:hypothetical protein